MEIKEAESILGISRSQIRFYEKEGLICPTRGENNYRCYSDADITSLKKIVVLRKLGFSVDEIAAMQKGELTLCEATGGNIARLEEEIDRLQEALELSRTLVAENAAFETLDEERYWRTIHEKEQAGGRFANIARDFALFELEAFDTMWKWAFFTDFKRARTKFGVWKACLWLLALCVLRGVGKVLIWHESFWDGFLYPFAVFGVGSLILTPLYILSKKAPRAAAVIANIMAILIMAFLAFLVLFIVGAVVYSFFK